MRKSAAFIVSIALMGCGSAATNPPPSGPQPQNVMEMSVGTFVEDTLYTQMYTPCADCTEVVMHTIDKVDASTYHWVEDIYYDHSTVNGTADGGLFCTVDLTLNNADIAGVDPKQRQSTDFLINSENCGYGATGQSGTDAFIFATVTVGSDGLASYITNWPKASSDTETFPGYLAGPEGAFAEPMRRCDSSQFASGRTYCTPACLQADLNSGACTLPTP